MENRKYNTSVTNGALFISLAIVLFIVSLLIGQLKSAYDYGSLAYNALNLLNPVSFIVFVIGFVSSIIGFFKVKKENEKGKMLSVIFIFIGILIIIAIGLLIWFAIGFASGI